MLNVLEPYAQAEVLMSVANLLRPTGFDYIREHIDDDPNHFFGKTAFLRLFTSFVAKGNEPDTDADLPEPLD